MRLFRLLYLLPMLLLASCGPGDDQDDADFHPHGPMGPEPNLTPPPIGSAAPVVPKATQKATDTAVDKAVAEKHRKEEKADLDKKAEADFEKKIEADLKKQIEADLEKQVGADFEKQVKADLEKQVNEENRKKRAADETGG